MVRFELKKIFAKSSNKIALIILLVAIVVISYFAIGSIEYVAEIVIQELLHITG